MKSHFRDSRGTSELCFGMGSLEGRRVGGDDVGTWETIRAIKSLYTSPNISAIITPFSLPLISLYEAVIKDMVTTATWRS
jgi:hypothetical protein